MNLFFCLIYILISTFAQNPLDYLNKKFERKLDINLYFHKNVKRQTLDSFKCNSKDGPNCNFLNSKMLGNQTLSDDIFIKNFKRSILSEIAATALDLEEMLTQNPQNMYFYTANEKNKDLDNFYDEKNGKIVKNEYEKELETLLTFDKIPLEEKEFLLKYTFQVRSLHEDINLVDVNFENFYVPPIGMINYKKVKSVKEKNNLLFKEENDEDDPEETYIYTKDKSGSIKFSLPVTLKYMYLRKNDFLKDKKLNPEKTQFQLDCYHKKKLVSQIKVTNPKGKYNTWIKVTVAKPTKIDEVIFEENTDLDNLFFYVDPTEIKEIKKQIPVPAPPPKIKEKIDEKIELKKNLEEEKDEIEDELLNKLEQELSIFQSKLKSTQPLTDKQTDDAFAKLFEFADNHLEEIPIEDLEKEENLLSVVDDLIEKQIKSLPPEKRRELEEEKTKKGKYNKKTLMKFMLEEMRDEILKEKNGNPKRKENNKKKNK